MDAKSFWMVALGVAIFGARISFAADETCAVCDREIVVTGEFSHSRAPEGLEVQGAARRADEAFREEISGTNFTVSVLNLPAGTYTLSNRPRGNGFHQRRPARV